MYEKYLQVVINNNSKSTDRIYTYGVTNELIDKVKIGTRVKVNFGTNRKSLEAIVVNIADDCNINKKKIKPINEVLDVDPIIKLELMKLAFWIRKRYTCKYIESLRLMMPSMIKYEQKILIKLNGDTNYSSLSKNEQKIVGIINNKTIELNTLKRLYNGKDLYKIIDNLKSKDIIKTKISEDTKKTVATHKIIELVHKRNTVDDYLIKRAKKQRQIIEYMFESGKELVLSELMKKLNVSLSSIKSLESKGFVRIKEVKLVENKLVSFNKESKKILNDEQSVCYKSIISSTDKVFLLHGVTGSGKTEVYLQLIDRCLNENKQAIVLVPEIALTPQTIERFSARFGKNIAVYHSRLSKKEKYEQWMRLYTGKADIVIGARSALFAPIKNLGLIIVDEEHEETYKSSSAPKYDAIEVAIKRAYLENCKVVLGSATPSIRSYYLAKKGYIKVLEIKNRIKNNPMPEIDIIDMREELSTGNNSMFSRVLINNMKNALNNKEQIILFLNRRGYSSFVSCRKCGEVIKCDRCDISMTYHADKNFLICHYCGKAHKMINKCPSCGSSLIKKFGIGTQQIEELVNNIFPKAKVKRMDFDTMKKKDSYEIMYRELKNHEIDILIGTQMIAKGLDLPDVTLVGVISADTSLNFPNYSSNEKTFQLITQVSGRAGRGNKKGKVIIQTYEPDNFVLKSIQLNNYELFMNNEIGLRKEFAYPPFVDLISVGTISRYEDKLNKVSMEKYLEFREATKEMVDKNKLLLYKPIPNNVYKVNNEYRINLFMKSAKSNSEELKKIIRKIYLNKDINDVKVSISFNNIMM